jgi:CRISPR-associated endoribonuclease Cas6
MRLHLTTTPNETLVPFNYHPQLVEVLHKWLGITQPDGKPALYSFSWLQNAMVSETGLNYPAGAKFFISFHNDESLRQALKSILNDAGICFGMQVTDVTIEENPDLTDKTLFRCANPIFVRNYENGQYIHYTYKDEIAGKLLEKMLARKMELAGLPKDESLKIQFDCSTGAPKTKIIDYKGIENRVNLCPVMIEGRLDTKQFAWNVGLGHSTGIGFGSIY